MATPAKKQDNLWDAAMLASAIKSGIYGAFVFFGEEDYLKSYYRDKIAQAIMVEGFETFNDFRISFSPVAGQKEEAMDKLADAIYVMPMMQEQKLIVITDLVPASMTKEALDVLCGHLAEASGAKDTVLLLYCRASEMETDYKLESSAFYKKLSANATMVRFDLQPRGKLVSWVRRQFAAEKIEITDGAVNLLIELCTGRMTPLFFEIQKLVCFAAGEESKTHLDEHDVEAIVVPSDPDEMPFAMLNAAQNWRLSEMLAVLAVAQEQREEPVAVLARLSRIYLDMLMIKAMSDDAVSVAEMAKRLKMKDFRIAKYREAIARVPIAALERAIFLCYETDKKLKSLQTDAWVLLDELAVNLYAPKSLREPTM